MEIFLVLRNMLRANDNQAYIYLYEKVQIHFLIIWISNEHLEICLFLIFES